MFVDFATQVATVTWWNNCLLWTTRLPVSLLRRYGRRDLRTYWKHLPWNHHRCCKGWIDANVNVRFSVICQNSLESSMLVSMIWRGVAWQWRRICLSVFDNARFHFFWNNRFCFNMCIICTMYLGSTAFSAAMKTFLWHSAVMSVNLIYCEMHFVSEDVSIAAADACRGL